MYEIVSGRWAWFWYVTFISAFLAVALVIRTCVLYKVMKTNRELIEASQQMHGFLERSADMVPRLLIENTQAYAIIRGLTGIKTTERR